MAADPEVEEAQVLQLPGPPDLHGGSPAAGPLQLDEDHPTPGQEDDAIRHTEPAGADPLEGEAAVAADHAAQGLFNVFFQWCHVCRLPSHTLCNTSGAPADL